MNRSDVNALYGKANNIYSGKLLNLVLSLIRRWYLMTSKSLLE